jgi:hypothetical protein
MAYDWADAYEDPRKAPARPDRQSSAPALGPGEPISY